MNRTAALLAVLGLVLVVAGVAQVYVPAAFIVAGLACGLGAWLYTDVPGGESR